MHTTTRTVGSMATLALLALGGAVAAQPSSATTVAASSHVVAKRHHAPATKGVVLRITDAKGHVRRGWHVVDGPEALSCDATPSPYVLGRDSHMCSPSVDDAYACVPDAGRTHLLCLTDPWTRTVVRFRVGGKLPVSKQSAHIMPLGVQLADGSRWKAPSGGAWAPGPQDSRIVMSCVKGCKDTEALVTGPHGAGPNILKDGATWYMRRGPLGSRLPKGTKAVNQRLTTVWYLAR